MTAGDDHDRRSRVPGLAGGALSMLTREAGRVPLLAVSFGLQAWQQTSGIRRLVLRRGNEVLQIAGHTPLGRFLPQPVFDDGAQEEATRIATAARDSAPVKPAAAKPKPAAAKATKPKPVAAKPAAAAKAPEPTPEPPAAAVEAGAPGVVTEQVEELAGQLAIEEPESREDLPIPDFDNISLGSLRARLRSLTVEQLVVLREWEQAHAHRLPVVTLLDNRIAKLAAQTPANTPTYPQGGGNGSPTGTGAQAADVARNAAREEGGTLRV